MRIVLLISFQFFLFKFTYAQINNSNNGLVECVGSLVIDEFGYVDDLGYLVLNKVVLGERIKYRALPRNGTSWEWDIGSGDCNSFVDFWKLQSNSIFKSKGKDAIITKSPLPTENSAFGSTNGLVKVFNGTERSCVNVNMEQFKVEVFFKKVSYS